MLYYTFVIFVNANCKSYAVLLNAEKLQKTPKTAENLLIKVNLTPIICKINIKFT